MKNDQVKIHFNYKQLDVWLKRTRNTDVIAGRAFGKTEGINSLSALDNLLTMPRSNGIIGERNYVNLLKITVPAMQMAWEKFGYYEDLHYWVKKSPPKHLNIPKAYRAPLNTEHYIQWYNGSGIFLAGMDRKSTMNGGSVDWQIYDELRLLKEDAVKEALLTLRGNTAIFGNNWRHLSVLKTTDMPQTKAQSWVLNNVDTMDKEAIDMIFKLQIKIEQLKQKKLTVSEAYAVDIDKDIKRLAKCVNELKKDNYYVEYATTIDNIHALGVDVIKGFKKELTALEYQRSVLNKKIYGSDGGFYPYFNEDIHTHEAINYHYLDTIELHKPGAALNCKADTDLDHTQALHIAMDFGANINLIVVGQRKNNGLINVLQYFYVTHPKLTCDVVEDLCKYYSEYKLKQYVFHYDHTAKLRTGLTENTYIDEVVDTFFKLGWTGTENFIGQQPSHDHRYRLFGKIWGKGGEGIPSVSINRTNCIKLIHALQSAETKQGRSGFEKNKNDERNKKVDQSDITHATDGLDTLVVGMMGEIYHRGDWV